MHEQWFTFSSRLTFDQLGKLTSIAPWLHVEPHDVLGLLVEFAFDTMERNEPLESDRTN